MTNSSTIIVISVLISVLIMVIIGYLYTRFYMNKDLNLLRKNVDELYNRLNQLSSDQNINVRSGKSNKVIAANEGANKSPWETLSDDEKKKISVHQSILRKVADDMIRSIVSPWPIQSMANTIPAMPKIAERPLWEDLVNNHVTTIDKSFGEKFDEYQRLIMEYARELPLLAREIQRYLTLNPSGIVNDFESNSKESPREIIYKRDLLFTLINFRLGYIDRPEIKTEQKQKKLSRTGIVTTLYFGNTPVAIIPQSFSIEFNSRIKNIIESQESQDKYELELEKAVQLKDKITSLKEECTESLTVLIRSETLYGRCNLI